MTRSPEQLLAQARRLRFTEPELERRFDQERFAIIQERERVVMALCALLAAALGWFEAQATVDHWGAYPGLATNLYLVRYALLLPLWAGVFLATFWSGFVRWVNTVNWVVLTLSCWGNALFLWFILRAAPAIDHTAGLIDTVLLVLVVGALLLTIRYRYLVLAVSLSVGGTILGYRATLGGPAAFRAAPRASELTLIAVGGLVLLVSWFREVADRTLFAREEQARRLAETMQGSVGCAAEPGRGATFWIDLPAAPAPRTDCVPVTIR